MHFIRTYLDTDDGSLITEFYLTESEQPPLATNETIIEETKIVGMYREEETEPSGFCNFGTFRKLIRRVTPEPEQAAEAPPPEEPGDRILTFTKDA